MNRAKIAYVDFSGGPLNVVLRGRAAGDCEVSPGCANCYAAPILRRSGQTPERTTYYPAKLQKLRHLQFPPATPEQPYRRGPGSRPLAFVCDMGDLFHVNVPDWFIVQVVESLQAEQPAVDFLLLTKRAERLAEFSARYYSAWPRNIWVGVTVETPAQLHRLAYLRTVPAPVRFCSAEPLLAAFDADELRASLAGIHWAIVGAESGAKRRSCDPAWALTWRAACQDTGTAFFYKQSSGLRPGTAPQLAGQTHLEYPLTDRGAPEKDR